MSAKATLNTQTVNRALTGQFRARTSLNAGRAGRVSDMADGNEVSGVWHARPSVGMSGKGRATPRPPADQRPRFGDIAARHGSLVTPDESIKILVVSCAGIRTKTFFVLPLRRDVSKEDLCSPLRRVSPASPRDPRSSRRSLLSCRRSGAASFRRHAALRCMPARPRRFRSR